MNESAQSNVPEFSVAELALSLKKTLEDTYSRIRVRGELSKVSIPGSGHLYTALKDDQAVIDAVCWRGTLARLSIRPEEGLEVICTGRISTYPKRSNYQLIIESMELAGEGALLKMLEERRKKLAAEGLFAQERKKPVPFLPDVIGVVTSPTGAVIRDILHRLRDRFPRHVLVWPVLVQGPGAEEQIARAIEGFDAIKPGGAVPRPDLLIVARGGGSLEDLMAFNEERVVRAAAACSVPLISAVGHETDTTLIDYAADLRAPTPTGAAEMAVPMRSHLTAQVLEDEGRLFNGLNRLLTHYRSRLDMFDAKMGRPERLIEVKMQSVDHAGDKLTRCFTQLLSERKFRVSDLGAKLRSPRDLLAARSQSLGYLGERLTRCRDTMLERPQSRLSGLAALLETLSFKNVLSRGFAVVRTESGAVVTGPQAVAAGQKLALEFRDEQKLGVIAEGKPASPRKTPKSAPKPTQKELF